MREIGMFEMTSGRMLISDPCYDKGTYCTHTLDVPDGIWTAFIKELDRRISELIVMWRCWSYNGPWEKIDAADIGVDSGQCGMFDPSIFRNSNAVPPNWWDKRKREIDSSNEWYNMNCSLTLSKSQAGVIPGGCVSSSGWGDGSYSLYVTKDNDEIVGVKVIFIEE